MPDLIPYRSAPLARTAPQGEPSLLPTRGEIALLVASIASIAFLVVGVPLAVLLLGDGAMWLAPVAFVIAVTTFGVGMWRSNKSYYAAVDARALRAIEELEAPPLGEDERM